MTDAQRFASVWNALEDTPQQAVSMRVRSELMMHLSEVIRGRGMTPIRRAIFFRLLVFVTVTKLHYAARTILLCWRWIRYKTMYRSL
jgi:hypothetical protein